MCGLINGDRRVLRLDPRDNLVVALTDLEAGEQVRLQGEVCTLVSGIPAKHKFAARDLKPGDRAIMYGVVVGEATQSIPSGSRITTQNLRHATEAYGPQRSAYAWRAPDISRWQYSTFQGYQRPDGQVGTRNYWLVVPLVFCENRNILALKQAFEEELGLALPSPYRQQVAAMAQLYREGRQGELRDQCRAPSEAKAPSRRLFQNLDGVKFLLHEGGCGGTREDTENLCGLLAGYVHHPNVAGATVLSLGCQHAQAEILREQLRLRCPDSSKPLLVFEQQKVGSEASMLAAATQETFLALVDCDRSQRVPAPLGKLRLGLKCGGSDGFSGISANPAVGHVSDLAVALGATTILSEFPELCGVEQTLIDRCISDEVSQRFITLMGDYAARARAVRASFAMNPSPGNIADGLITDAMKSAGAARKGGSSPVTAVLDYPEYAATAGLNLQCTPGNDVECVTAQAGAGANLVLFTTGLGTPTGNPVAPVIKISSNSELPQRMPDIIDIDAGDVISGRLTIEEAGEKILEYAISVASGDSTCAERLRQDDFIPWKRGVSL